MIRKNKVNIDTGNWIVHKANIVQFQTPHLYIIAGASTPIHWRLESTYMRCLLSWQERKEEEKNKTGENKTADTMDGRNQPDVQGKCTGICATSHTLLCQQCHCTIYHFTSQFSAPSADQLSPRPIKPLFSPLPPLHQLQSCHYNLVNLIF